MVKQFKIQNKFDFKKVFNLNQNNPLYPYWTPKIFFTKDKNSDKAT
jgi:hypothetical protein